MNCSIHCISRGLFRIDATCSWIGLLGIRLLLAYEFRESGVEKFRVENWFADIQAQFSFPFSRVPVDINCFFSTWVELIGAVMLVIGLGTRFWAFSLMIPDVVAWYAIHAGSGYNVCDNGYSCRLCICGDKQSR